MYCELMEETKPCGHTVYINKCIYPVCVHIDPYETLHKNK